MQTIHFLRACQGLAHLMQQVNDEHEPIKVEHPEKGAVVLMSEYDYQGLIETLYLLSHPVNAEKLLQAVARNSEEATEWSQVKTNLGL